MFSLEGVLTGEEIVSIRVCGSICGDFCTSNIFGGSFGASSASSGVNTLPGEAVFIGSSPSLGGGLPRLGIEDFFSGEETTSIGACVSACGDTWSHETSGGLSSGAQASTFGVSVLPGERSPFCASGESISTGVGGETISTDVGGESISTGVGDECVSTGVGGSPGGAPAT